MDDMTKRLWAAEFERQYPRPVRVAGAHVNHGAAATAYAAASIAASEALNGKEMCSFEKVMHRGCLELHYLESLVFSRETNPWNVWRNECRDRFAAIYAAEPLHALAALRGGDLLIEPAGASV